jgi:hypothetical protein
MLFELGLAALAVPAAAKAAPWTRDAGAVRATLATAPAIDPVAANRGAAECRTQSAGGNLPAGLPLGIGGRVEAVERFRLSHTGRFRVVLPGAKRRQVAVFRFRTRVRFSTRNPRLYRTFTLPQYVDVG